MNTGKLYSRQSFLGPNAESIFKFIKVAVVGTGGGGSHIVQQLLHVGFKNIVVFDPDRVEESNLYRMVGATSSDVGRLKVDVMTSLAERLAPDAKVLPIARRWQEVAEVLQECDLVFGCVDGFSERHQLESTARRYLVPYIDIGLDVHTVDAEVPQMAGQVILSMPGSSCMSCLAFLTEEKLSQEGLAYGAAGPRAQVIWANGALASTAVGLAVDLLTDWTGSLRDSVFLLYHGNLGTIGVHPKWMFRQKECKHYPLSVLGPPKLIKL